MINIYKMTCETGKVYYGSTKLTLKKRLRGHKDKKNCACKDFINPKMELLETCNEEEKKDKESYYIRNFDCINKRIENRTREEWYNNYKEVHKENLKKWYIKNKHKRQTKIICECGIEIMKSSYIKHSKTKKHLKNLVN